MKSKVISLSAISAAFVAIALIIGGFFEMTDFFMLILASVFVMLPLYLNSFKGSFLAYFAGGVIAVLLTFNFALIFPAYFGFFGIYPIVKCKMLQKNFNKAWGIVIGLIWLIAVSYGCYFYYTLILGGVFTGLPEWIYDYIIYGIGLIAIVLFFVFDRFVVVVRLLLDKYLNRIIK